MWRHHRISFFWITTIKVNLALNTVLITLSNNMPVDTLLPKGTHDTQVFSLTHSSISSAVPGVGFYVKCAPRDDRPV
ncbi:hypothetical protein ABKN59_008250 [Abortiporus biennis]